MAMPLLNHTETPLNFVKFKKNAKNSNLKSFWAILLSIFIYISVFYVFNLSPSTLFTSTKFWFFISNTLILIVAVDFDALSSSKEHDHLYEEYVKNDVRAKNVPSLEKQYEKIDEKKMPSSNQKREAEEEPNEKIVGMVLPVATDSRHAENPNEKFEKIKIEIVSTKSEAENGGPQIKKRRSTRRSNSDKAILMLPAAAQTEEKMDLRRTVSERQEESRSKENDFSRMSNEELNRRAEEFIQRVNKQIRLQAARNQLQLGVTPYLRQ